MQRMRLILVPGMGSDQRLFDPQRACGLDFEAAPLPIPEANETLPHYAKRIRELMRIAPPCVIGGISFGGMLACEMARFCSPRCVILIASTRDRSGIPPSRRWLEWISRLVPDTFIDRRRRTTCRLLGKLESLSPHQLQFIERMALDIPMPLLRQSGRMIARWNSSPRVECPIHHIHGARDRIIPVSRVQPDRIIPDGGHLINITHAAMVTRYIQHCCENHAS